MIVQPGVLAEGRGLVTKEGEEGVGVLGAVGVGEVGEGAEGEPLEGTGLEGLMRRTGGPVPAGSSAL